MPDRPTVRFIYNVIRDRNYSREDYIMNLGGRGRRLARRKGRDYVDRPVRPSLLKRLGCDSLRGPSPWKLSGPLRCERVEIIGRDIASRSFQGLSNGRGIISVRADGRFVFAFRMRKMDGCLGWSRSRVRVGG